MCTVYNSCFYGKNEKIVPDYFSSYLSINLTVNVFALLISWQSIGFCQVIAIVIK